MKRPIRHLIAVATLFFALALLPAIPALAAGPGFDCAKATRQIDKAICAWDTVGSLDGRMAAAYKTAIAAQHGETAVSSAKADQKAWLAGRDSRCALKNVKPREGNEEGLSPQQFGQLMCLQLIYPLRIAQLMDIAAPPLAPRDIKMVPIAPLKAAYPGDWQQAGYQAQFSPDKSLMALGVEDSAGYVKQVWLYQPASGRLVVASPRAHVGKTEKPEDISALNSWVWGGDGRFYLRARRPLGKDSVFGADMHGYAAVTEAPSDVAAKFAANDAARKAVLDTGKAPEGKRPPGFDDNSDNEQEGGAFVAWAQNKGHGAFDLMAARDGDEEPRIIASGGWELKDFMLDPSGSRLFYNGEGGLLVTDPDTRVTRRLKGTRGTSLETRPINMAADGEILVYSASGSCARDAANVIDSDMDDDSATDDSAKRVCLAYLEPAGNAPAPKPPLEPVAAKAEAAPPGPWVGKWAGSGEGSLSATIRRGTAKPDYLVVDLSTAVQGCSGAVTLYGKPKGTTLRAESYAPSEPAAPVCWVELSIDKKGALKTEAVGPCTFYHGGACGFDGSMTRSE